MKTPSLMTLCAKFLHSHPGQKFDVHELAAQVLSENSKHFTEKKRRYEAENPGRSVAYQLEREIYARRHFLLKQHPDITIDASDKIRFFAPYGAGSPLATAISKPTEKPKELIKSAGAISREADLYPAVQAYLFDGEGIVSKRIRESTSSNRRGKGSNKWLHPDIAGMYVPGAHWEELIRECSAHLPTRKAKLISVEVKTRIVSSDVREYFFQTVSNSLWANRAYLAASEINGEDTWQELRMLCSLHGIGYMLIDPDDVSASRIIIPAREREEVDWASVNRIAVENSDFREYLKLVLNYLQTGQLIKRLWEFTK
jgi:uncharacterized protein